MYEQNNEKQIICSTVTTSFRNKLDARFNKEKEKEQEE